MGTPPGTGSRRALVLSESEVLRLGLCTLCASTGLEAVGQLSSPEELDERARAERVQLVVAAPLHSDSEEVYRALRRLAPACRSLLLLAVPGFRIRAAVLRRRYGLCCLPLDVDAAAFAAAVDDLFAGGPDGLTVEELVSGPGGVLTPREQEVLQELAQGHGNRAIAERLFLSEDTVKSHLRKVYRKLGVTSRAEAVALYVGELGT